MEKVIFRMPEDPEMFVAALGALQAWTAEQESQITHTDRQLDDYSVEVRQSKDAGRITDGQYYQLTAQIGEARRRNQERMYDLTVNLPNEDFDFFIPAFGKSQIVYGDVVIKRGDWDFAHVFDPKKAEALAAATQRHASAAFGILIGAECSSLVNLSMYPVQIGTTIDLLMVGDWPERKAVEDLALRAGKNVQHVVGLDWYATFDCISGSDMIVGPRSAATYIACCLEKRVVELYPITDNRRWLSKWDNPNYQMICNKDYPAGLVWRAMETLWERPRTSRTRSAPGSRTQMGLRTSVAGLAVASSPEQGVL